jgi:hypothetical protein
MLAGLLVSGVIMLIFAAAGAAGSSFAVVLGVIFVFGLMLLAMSLVGALFLAAPVSLAIDHTGPFSALGKSFHLATSNFKAHCLSYLFLQQIPLILYMPALIIALLRQAHALNWSPALAVGISTPFSLLGSVVSLAVFAGYVSLVYLDGRCRRDHLDLLLLARDLGMEAQVKQALLPATVQFARPRTTHYAVAGYPNYAPASSSSGFPDYSRAPEAQSLAPAAPSAAADYAAFPPDAGTAEAPPAALSPSPDLAPGIPLVSTAFPDYSAAPPPVSVPEPLPVSAPPVATGFPDDSVAPTRDITPAPPQQEEPSHVS